MASFALRWLWGAVLGVAVVFCGAGTRVEGALFYSDFESEPLGALTSAGVWSSVSAGTGTAEVMTDSEEIFGEGSGNRFLRIRDAKSMWIMAGLSDPAEVVTLRFSFVGRNRPTDNRWVHFNFLTGTSTTTRAHILSLNLINQTIRDRGVSYGANDEALEFAVVYNNRPTGIVYDGMDGVSRSLGGRMAAVWINGQLALTDYSFGSEGVTGPIRNIAIQTDSTAVVSFDLDNFLVTAGALGAEPVPAPPPPMATLGEDGRLVYSTDLKGNRIPDFSNSGYMGGGVEIPDVPARVVLIPSNTGDDTARIQNAIGMVSAMPLDENGFRGAVLLKAGEYRISGTLRINTSGVVLRGEGDGEDGTILRATGTTQRTLIQVRGTGSWQEVAGSRRQIVDEYVPVGARSFTVANASGFQVGDMVIVHRPSTAEWISAIGMDKIPPRSDGGTVTQWKAGSFDLRFDRTIVAIEGNRITIDAPLTNALEAIYGGGSIYRYTFPGRISQVGVEYMRSVSDFAGGTWTTSRDDENHAWTFIDFNAAQNGWVRNTTAVHYGFGNTFLERYAKWITVQDSQNLYPVSTITGSRRYPFYVTGQLNLVQRCYANYARHDYGTNSLTFGPNVFLDSDGEESYSDTGPHHRWATGTLYDNIRIARDIAVQNRLNYGSGHGWAGANHVVWNSTARRTVVQNPPTAQNWAIGVIGEKWTGAFPSYASDGYWISHGARVEPGSLYLKQLEDRLAPEGEGGTISVVSWKTNSPVSLAPGEDLALSFERLGNVDGPAEIAVEFLGDGADLLEVASEGRLAAGSRQGQLSVRLREGARRFAEVSATVRLRHTERYAVGANSEVEVAIPGSPWHEWRREHFSEEQLADDSISGPEADPAGDGVANLLKYALDLPPFSAVGKGDWPTVSVVDGKLAISFPRGDSRPDIDYVVEVSSDLVSWESGPEFTDEFMEEGEPGWPRVTVTDKADVSGADRRFIRLKAVLR